MKRFYVDMFYNSEHQICKRIFCLINMISVLLLICLGIGNNIWNLEDYIFYTIVFIVAFIFFIDSVIRKSFTIDKGYIKKRKKKVDICAINYVIITKRIEQLGRANIVPLYEKISNENKKIVIARMFFQDEFHFDVEKCENSRKFEHTKDIRLSYYNTLFRTDYQANLLETLFENGLNASFYIKREVYEDRRQEFDSVFQIYYNRIKRICIFS